MVAGVVVRVCCVWLLVLLFGAFGCVVVGVVWNVLCVLFGIVVVVCGVLLFVAVIIFYGLFYCFQCVALFIECCLSSMPLCIY